MDYGYNQFNRYPQQQPGSLIKVSGPDEVRQRPTAPNTVVAMFKDTGGVFYLKVTDANGFATNHAYSYEEIPFDPQPQQLDTSGLATKEEVAQLSQGLSEVLEELRAMKTQGKPQQGQRGRQNG